MNTRQLILSSFPQRHSDFLDMEMNCQQGQGEGEDQTLASIKVEAPEADDAAAELGEAPGTESGIMTIGSSQSSITSCIFIVS